MKTFSLLMTTPEITLFEDEVLSAVFPGEKGFFEILPNHAPFIGMIKPGFVDIVNHKKEKHRIKTTGGFCEVNQNIVTFLCSPN